MNNSYYDSKNHFNGIQFDRLTPLLSCELNELQEILQHKIEDYIRDTSMSCIYSQLEMTVANGTLTFDKDIVSYLNGIRFFVPSTHVDLLALADGDHAIVFMEAWKEVASRDSALTEYGGEGLSAVTNNIKPPYSDNDITSERVVWKWRLRVEKFDVSKKYNTGNDKFPYLGYDSSTVFSPMYARGGGIFAIPATVSGEEVFRPANGSYKKFSEDTNLWIAGDATTEFKELFNSEDGFVYALPLVRLSAHLDTSNNLVLDVAQESTTEGISKINEQIEDIFKQLNQVAIQGKQYTDAQIQLVTATGIPKLVSYPYKVFATVDGQTKFDIPYEQFNSATDTLLVARNGSDITNDKNDHSKDLYTVTDPVESNGVITKGFVTLNTGISAGSFLGLKILKNVPIGAEGSMSGRAIAKDTLPQDRIIGINDILAEIHASTSEIHMPKLQSELPVSDYIVDISTDETKQLALTRIAGNTRINLIPDSNCEDASRWFGYQANLTTDTSNKAFGGASIKVTATVANSSCVAYKPNYFAFLAPNKYYCVSAYVKNGNLGNPIGISVGAVLTGVTTGRSVKSSDSNLFARIFTMFATSSGMSADIDISGIATAVGQYFFMDGVMVEEVTQEQYNDPNYVPPCYFSGDLSTGDLYRTTLRTRGKNMIDLVQGTIDWTNNGAFANYAPPSRLTHRKGRIPVKPNTNYVVSLDKPLICLTGEFDISGVALSNNSWGTVPATQLSFKTGINTKYVGLVFKLDETTILYAEDYKIQMEEGTIASDYEPYRETSITIEEALRSINTGISDSITDGKHIQRVGKTILGANITYEFNGSVAGYKRIGVPVDNIQFGLASYTWGATPNGIAGNMLIKPSGKILNDRGRLVITGVSSSGSEGVSFWDNGKVYIDVPSSDSGWGDSYTPTQDEIRAFFLGWKMYSSNDNGASVAGIYNGTGTKFWGQQWIGSGINEGHGYIKGTGLGANVVPTSMAGYYPSYRLLYPLATPVISELDIPKLVAFPKGSLVTDSESPIFMSPRLVKYQIMDSLKSNLESLMRDVSDTIRVLRRGSINVYNINKDNTGIGVQQNADDYIKTGVYISHAWINYPVGMVGDSQGILIVSAYSDGWVHQTFITPHENKICSRQRTNYQWTPWIIEVGSLVNLGSQLPYYTNWTPSGGTGYNNLTKDSNNQVVYAYNCQCAIALSAGGDYPMCTLPAGYRPSGAINIFFRASNATIHSGWIDQNGIVHLQPSSALGAGAVVGGTVVFTI